MIYTRVTDSLVSIKSYTSIALFFVVVVFVVVVVVATLVAIVDVV